MEAALIGLIGAWGVYQNFWNIGSPNLYSPDETTYARAGWAYLHGDFSLNTEHPFVGKYIIGVFQVVFGQGVDSARLAAATATLIGGAIMWWWVRSAVERWCALIAVGIWLLLPQWLYVYWGPRGERFALLEPFMIMFSIAACAFAWKWVVTRHSSAMVLSALCLALAVSSKVSAAALLPVLALYPLLRHRDRRAVYQTLSFIVTTSVVGLATYLPSGSIISPIAAMIEFQSRHNLSGHNFEVAGAVYKFQPWWASLAWLVLGVGLASTAALVAGSSLALLYRRNAFTLFVGLILVAFLVFYSAVTAITLPHYYLAFVPWLSILAAIGLTAPWSSAARTRSLRVGSRSLAICCAGVLLVSSISASFDTIRLRPFGVARVGPTLAELGLPAGPVIVTGLAAWEWGPYLDDVARKRDLDFVAIVIHRGWLRERADPRILAMVDDHPGDYRLIRLDQVELYIPRHG